MNGYGNSVFLRTAWEVSSGGTPPANTVAPVISGTQVVGSTLTSTTGTWTGSAPITYTYQWFRGATLIGGATSSTYVLVQADAGNTSNITCKVTGTNGSGNATATSNTLAQIFDFDANAFITSAVITDTTQKAATNSFTIDLKGYNIWTKMKAVYPFVGGTAATHKFNLKNPLDTNAAFRASFVGGITHSSTGVKGNGINAYFDTWIIPSDLFTSASGGSMFAYIRNNTGTGADLGAFQAGVNYRMQLTTRTTLNEIAGAALSNNFILETNLDSRGFWGVTRPPSSSTYHLIKNTTSSSNTDSYFEPNAYLKGLALGIDLSNQIIYSDHELAFVCVADGLTTTEAQTLRTINLTFQTTLGRQV